MGLFLPKKSVPVPNNRVMPKPNLRFVSRMAFGHFMRFTTLPVCLGIHWRYDSGHIQ